MHTTGQMFPYNWDEVTMAEQMTTERLGMDPIDVAFKDIHGPSSQTDPTVTMEYKKPAILDIGPVDVHLYHNE
jgi:hypothetical protein